MTQNPTLTAAIRHWDELIAEDRSLEDSLPELREWMLERGLRIDDRPLCSVLRPHLVAEDDLRRKSEVAELIISAIYRVRDALVADRGLHLKHLGMFREWIGDLLDLDTHPAGDGALLRLDASLARTRLHYIELNADSPQGMGHNDGLVDFFERLDAYERFTESYRVRPLRLQEKLLETMLAVWADVSGDGKPVLGIVTSKDDPVRVSALELDLEFYARRGIDATIADVRELEFDGRRLRHGDRELDLVHRVLLTAECLESRDEMEPLLDAVKDGAVAMVNSFRSELLGHKALFALLTDPGYEFGFSAAERAAIRTHVPWTRQVFDGKTTDPHGSEVDLVEYLVRHRAQLVLKPTHDAAGRGVHLGWRQDESEWRDAIAAALESDFIAQHRVELQREEYPTMDAPGARELYYEDTDPFLFRGQIGGMLTRLSPSEVTNVHQHGSVVAPFAIAPR